jgi:LmbE family N-acetylglucosaminyl deacetylase
VKPAASVRAMTRWLLAKLAHDATDQAARRSALVIAPHPDDETLGCGARIRRARAAGHAVTIVVVGDGSGSHGSVGVDHESLRQRRTGELADACARLGVARDHVHQLGYPDDGLADHLDDIVADLARVLREVGPDDVYVTCADEQHPDHAAAAHAAATAVAQCEPAPRLLEYPIWLWSDWPVSRRFRNGSGLARWLQTLLTRSVEVVQVGDVRASKLDALSAYRSQLGEVDLPSDLTEYRPAAGSVALPAVIVGRALDEPELYFRTRRRRPR